MGEQRREDCGEHQHGRERENEGDCAGSSQPDEVAAAERLVAGIDDLEDVCDPDADCALIAAEERR